MPGVCRKWKNDRRRARPLAFIKWGGIAANVNGRARIALAPLALAVGVIAAAGMASATTVTVNLANGLFLPANPHIEPGDTVIFWNNDTQGHDVIFKDGPSSGVAGGLAPGQNWSRTFDTAGVYELRCRAHSGDFAYGMVGAVLVGNVTPPPPKTPGFEVVSSLVAVGAAAALAAFARKD